MTPTRNALVQDCGDRIQRVWVPARSLIVQPSAAGSRVEQALCRQFAEGRPIRRARPLAPGLPFDACHGPREARSGLLDDLPSIGQLRRIGMYGERRPSADR